MTQGEGETIHEFVTRLKTCASDCSFVCPFEETHDLTDCHLINRLQSGIFPEALQQELLQKQDILNIVPSIVTYCEAYECAVIDKEKLSRSASTHEPTANSLSIVTQFDITNDELVSAVSLYKKRNVVNLHLKNVGIVSTIMQNIN